MSKTLVYTAIFGSEDSSISLSNRDAAPANTDFICFTDNPNLQSEDYIIVFVKPNFSDPTRNARQIKVCGTEHMKDYTVAIWHDYSLTMDCSKLSELIEFASKYTISLFNHDETCSYAEARKCIELKKDKVSVLVTQMLVYALAKKLPTRNGVFETGIIVIDVETYFGSPLQLKWWRDIDRFSKRDQLSLPCIKYQLKVEFGILEGRGHINPYSTYRKSLTSTNATTDRTLSVWQKLGIWWIYKLELFINRRK
ncbi:MAG: DUF616 domain-containing protein [Flavobacteriales bacterium]|nr:DUF616 domain-containing protein [Flavobacteriales bacterium]